MPRAFVAIEFLRHRQIYESFVRLTGIFFIGFGLYAMRRRSGPSPFAQRADLEIDDAEIRGACEGRAVSVSWKRVRSVEDKLTAKRGLIIRPARKLIVNSVR